MYEKNFNVNLSDLEKFCEDASHILNVGSIICLSGELGSGKTTFARYLINSIYKKNKLEKPKSIKSPTFPILLTYDVYNFEIYHYDLYRIINANELDELNIFEELNNSITLIEWPEVILGALKNYNYFSINFKIINENTRTVEHNLIFS